VTPLTATAMTATLMQQVGNMKKLVGYYQKSMNTVVKGLQENASKLEVQLFSTDAFIVSVGDRVSRILRMDKAGEKLATTAFRLIFMIRAGIPSETVHGLVNDYLKDAPALRQTVLESIRHSERFMANRNEVTANRQRMSSRLEEYFATEKGRGEYRLAGINSLLLVLNAVDFIYLCGQVRDDKKPLASLLASGLAMVSQGTTVILPAIEKGLEAGKLTVAWVKGVGAAAGGTASLISVYTDWCSMKSEFQNNRFFLVGVLGLKTFVDVLAVTKSVGLLLEAISAVFEVKGKEQASRIIGLGGKYIADKLVKKYFGVRVLAILVTWEAMVAITLLQVVVTWISDDELQIWCEKCVFGAAPFKRSVADQNKALEAAIKDIS
ncbi:hypothetical protein L8P40_22460, partial [Enterobacter kobei]